MRESEFKLFPESIMRKLISLKEEGISQDIEIFPVLLFVGVNEKTHFTYERILKILKDTSFPFGGEILDVHSDYVIISFDIFRFFGDETAKAIALAQQLIDLDFVGFVFITRRRGFFRYINIKGREFIFIDSGAYSEYSESKNNFSTGIYVDENVYYELYHNAKVEPVGEQVLRVLDIRERFIPNIKPLFVGKNPLKSVSQGGVFTVRGDKGTGKTRISLQFLLDGGFERIAYVKLWPASIAIPFSAINELARSLEFYREANGESSPEFVKRILSEKVKTAVFFDNAEYMDGDSREFLREIIASFSDTCVFVFESGPRWEDEVTVMLENYVESKGVSILKAIAGGRRPDKTVLEVLSAVNDPDYQFVYDFYSIFSLKKYFIFGEDVFYLSPAAHKVKKDFSRDVLYDLLFESLDEVETRELLKIVLYGGKRALKDVRLTGLARLIKHGILRVDGNEISLSSGEISKRFPRWVEKDRILAFLESELSEDDYLMRGYILRLIGEKRAAFRELKRYLGVIDSDELTRKYILEILLDLEPTVREKIEILLELHDAERSAGNYDLAMSHLKEALRVAKSTGDKEEIARVLYMLGKFNLEIGQNGAALMNFKDARRFAKESKNREVYVSILIDMIEFYREKGDMDRFGELLDELESVEIESNRDKARALYYRGMYNLNMGNINKAHSVLEDAYNLTRKLDDRELTSHVLAALSKAEFMFGQFKVAERYAEESLSINPECIEARIVLSRVKFLEHDAEEAFRILYEVSGKRDTPGSYRVLSDLAALFAYRGQYRTAIEYLDRLLNTGGGIKKDILKRKIRYLLRLGRYAEAFKFLSEIEDEELNDEFNIFLMADKYKPGVNTPYIKAVVSFATLSRVEDLDFSVVSDYDYIDAGWMVEFNRGINELISGSYETAYEIMKRMENMYFKATLGVNIAKYIIDRGGDGNMFLREAGDIAEKEGYLEVLMWLYLILGKKNKAEELFATMFGDNTELRDNYIQARREVFEKI